MRKLQGKIKDAKLKSRERRRLSARKKIVGTAERPRVCLNKTNKYLVVQVIDDEVSKTHFSVQTFGKAKIGDGANKSSAALVGQKVADELKARNISSAVFDRAGSKYTGLISMVCGAIRENGISI